VSDDSRIVPVEVFQKRKKEKMLGGALDNLVTEEEAQRLVEGLFLGQGSCTEAEGMSIIRWATLARVRGIILNAILSGHANAALDGKGEVKIVPIDKDIEE